MPKVPEGTFRAIFAILVSLMAVGYTVKYGLLLPELGYLTAGVLTAYFGTRAIEDRKKTMKAYPLWLPIGYVRFILTMIFVVGMGIYAFRFNDVPRDLASLAGYCLLWYFGNRFLGKFKGGL